MVDPFIQSEKLISISTGIKATSQTESNLFTAQTNGENALQTIIEKQLLKEDEQFFIYSCRHFQQTQLKRQWSLETKI